MLQDGIVTGEKLNLDNNDKSLAPFGNLVKTHTDKNLSMSGSASDPQCSSTLLQRRNLQKAPNLTNTPHEALQNKICYTSPLGRVHEDFSSTPKESW